MALACLSNECWSYIYLPYRVVQRLTGSTATGHLFAAELVCISMLLSIFRIVRHQCLFLLLVVEVSRFTAYATPLRLRQLDTQSRYVSAGSGPAEAHRQSSGIQLEMQELWRASNAASKHTNLAQLSHALNSGQPCQQTLDKYFVPSGAQLLDQARISACTHLAAASLTDGYGAQLKRRLGVWAFAHAHGLHYAHNPIHKSKLHGLNAHIIGQLDAFLNYAHGELRLRPDSLLPYSHPGHDLGRYSRAGGPGKKDALEVCWVARCDGSNSTFVETHPEALAALQPLLFTKLRASNHRLQPRAFDPHRINVAVHIRRGDITQTAEESLNSNSVHIKHKHVVAMQRYVPERWYHAVMLEVAAALADTGFGVPLFHLYSEGLAKDFPLLQDLDIHSRNMSGKVSTSSAPLQLVWHLDEDLGSTLAGMLYSDIFVMGHSSLSYIAALFRGAAAPAPAGGGGGGGGVSSSMGTQKGIAGGSGDKDIEATAGLTLYHEQWQVAMPHWMKYTGPGSFGTGLRQQGALRSMQTALARRTQAKAGSGGD